MSAAEWLQCAATIALLALQLRMTQRLRNIEHALEEATEAHCDFVEARVVADVDATAHRAQLAERLRAEIRRSRGAGFNDQVFDALQEEEH